MTQRIFDIENEEDMQDLWDILPDDVYEIHKGGGDSELDNTFFFKNGYVSTVLISINWHDETKITRPVNYEDMVGCVGWFENEERAKNLGILTKVTESDEDGYVFCKDCTLWYKYFTPAKKSELNFWENEE